MHTPIPFEENQRRHHNHLVKNKTRVKKKRYSLTFKLPRARSCVCVCALCMHARVAWWLCVVIFTPAYETSSTQTVCVCATCSWHPGAIRSFVWSVGPIFPTLAHQRQSPHTHTDRQTDTYTHTHWRQILWDVCVRARVWLQQVDNNDIAHTHTHTYIQDISLTEKMLLVFWDGPVLLVLTGPSFSLRYSPLLLQVRFVGGYIYDRYYMCEGTHQCLLSCCL